MSVKNLQVVSFDSEWKEIYLGTIRRNHFSAFCPHNVPNAVSIDYKWLHQDEGPDQHSDARHTYQRIPNHSSTVAQ